MNTTLIISIFVIVVLTYLLYKNNKQKKVTDDLIDILKDKLDEKGDVEEKNTLLHMQYELDGKPSNDFEKYKRLQIKKELYMKQKAAIFFK